MLFPRRSLASILAVLLCMQLFPASSIAARINNLKEGECRIDVGKAHISDYFTKRGRLAVKVNVLSECFMRQEKTTFWVQIRKKGRLFDHEVVTEIRTITNKKSGNKPIYFEGTYAFCKNSKMTTYYGIGQAWAIINGKRYSTNGRARSEKDVTIPCGT